MYINEDSGFNIESALMIKCRDCVTILLCDLCCKSTCSHMGLLQPAHEKAMRYLALTLKYDFHSARGDKFSTRHNTIQTNLKD